MSIYTNLKQDIKDSLRECFFVNDFSDLIDIQMSLMSSYRHCYCCYKNDAITHDEAINLGCTLKAMVKSISYSLYYNEMITIDDIIKLFDETIEFYENSQSLTAQGDPASAITHAPGATPGMSLT